MHKLHLRLPLQRVVTAVAPLLIWLTSNQVEARMMPLIPPPVEVAEVAPLVTGGMSQPTPPPARPQQPTSPSPGHSAQLRETSEEMQRREREQRKVGKGQRPQRELAAAPPRPIPEDPRGAEPFDLERQGRAATSAPEWPPFALHAQLAERYSHGSAYRLRASTLLASEPAPASDTDLGAWQPAAPATPAATTAPTPEPAPVPVAPATSAAVPAAPTPAGLPTPAPTPLAAPVSPAPEPSPVPGAGTTPPPYSAPTPTAATRATDPTMACAFGVCRKKRGGPGLPRLSVALGKGTLSMNLYADVGYAIGPQRKHRYRDYITGETVEDFGRRDFTSYPLYVNQFSLAYGFVQGQYEIPEKLRIRFALHAGHIVESLYYEEKKSLQLIREAALMYYIVPQVAVEAGILPSYYGAEIVLNKENIHATRAYIADFTPDYEAGVRLHIFPRKDMALRFQVLNGWQEIKDANGRKGYGFVWSIMRPGQIVGDWCMYWGNEAALGEKEPIFRHYQNPYYRIWVGKRWLLFPMLDFVMQKNNATNRFDFVVSPAFSVRYGITDKVGVAVRWDYLYNRADIVPELRTNTPNGWQSNSGTATLEYLPLPQLTFRVEGRYGTNKDAVFRDTRNTLVREDWYVIFAASFHI